MRQDGATEFHGYELARQIGTAMNRRLLTGYGTLYRALARLEDMGLLSSRREDAEVAAQENRPRRRLYTLTARYAPADDAIPGTAKTPAGRRRVVPA
jgi:DNA-binding PadR family transcriptional regulator